MKSEKISKEFFDSYSEDYAKSILGVQGELYENTKVLIDKVIESKGAPKVLDIGNGGVINYSFDKFEELLCVDLSLSKNAIEKYKAYDNVHFKEDNIFNLDLDSNQYDYIIIQYVIHHLAGDTIKESRDNVNKGLREAMRVLKPGGKIIIVESVVYSWFEFFEIHFWKFFKWFYNKCRFCIVYQFSIKSLLTLIKANHDNVKCKKIKMGPFVWQMKFKVPTLLSPCRAYMITIKKDEL